MAKAKKPAPKGGKKIAAPKKGVKKVAPKKLTERQADQLNADKMRADAFASTQPAHPTVEKQHTAGHSYLALGENEMTQHTGTPAWIEDDVPPKPAKRGWFARFRSAITGRWVKPLFAKLNPSTTVREKVRK